MFFLIKSPYLRYWHDETTRKFEPIISALVLVLALFINGLIALFGFFCSLFWLPFGWALGCGLFLFVALSARNILLLLDRESGVSTKQRSSGAAFQIIGGILIFLGMLFFLLHGVVGLTSSGHDMAFLNFIGLACVIGGAGAIIWARVRLMATPAMDDDDDFVSPWQAG